MKKLLMSIGAALVLFFATTAPNTAKAQAMCGERRVVVENLKKTYSEAPVSIGLASNGSVIEVLASPSGSFTIILTQPNGVTCVMAAGENWENLPPQPVGEKI